MNWRTPRPLLLLAILLASAALLLWTLRYDATPPAPPRLGDNNANNSFSEVSYRMRDAQGTPVYRISADQLDQFSQPRKILLQQAYVKWLSHGYENSWGKAERGVVQQSTLELRGSVNVMLKRPQEAPALLQSASLVLDPDQERIHSTQEVILSSPQTIMRGTGLEYWMERGSGSLHTNVNSRHFAASLDSPDYSLLRQIAEASFSTAHAADGNGDLEVSADHIDWDIEKKVYVYRGNVHAERDTLVLTADKLSVFSEDGKVKLLLAEGNATWTQRFDSGDPMNATAENISYEISDRKVVLTEQVTVLSGEAEFTGDRVVWLLDENRIAAGAEPGSPDTQKRQRVRIRLDTK